MAYFGPKTLFFLVVLRRSFVHFISMNIAHYLFITLFFLIAQNYCVSQTIEALGDTNISIEELLAARGDTNAIRCDAYFIRPYDKGYLITNDEKVKSTFESLGGKAPAIVDEVRVVDQTVFAIVDTGVYYFLYNNVYFVPFSEIEYIDFRNKSGLRYAVFILKD